MMQKVRSGLRQASGRTHGLNLYDYRKTWALAEHQRSARLLHSMGNLPSVLDGSKLLHGFVCSDMRMPSQFRSSSLWLVELERQGDREIMWCNYCDPKYFIVYGFCVNCGRRCQPPLFDPRKDDAIEWDKMRTEWNKERADLVLDSMRRMPNE